MKIRARILGPLLLALGAGVAAFLFKDRVRHWIPIHSTAEFAIAIYTGPSPLSLSPATGVPQPTLTRDDVSDVSAAFVADPFMIQKDQKWWLFFEVLNERNEQGDIGLAFSPDGRSWQYDRIVLDEPFHLSYPYVFEHDGKVYMLPEAGESHSLRLYAAVQFPHSWRLETTLLRGTHLDPSLIYHAGHWWLFSATSLQNDELTLFWAEHLTGPWHKHPASPIVSGDAHRARPGGRVIETEGRLYRFAQDDYPNYGRALRAFEILELSTTRYREREAPEFVLKASGQGWNAAGMHHADPHQLADKSWIAAVDGHRFARVLGFP